MYTRRIALLRVARSSSISQNNSQVRVSSWCTVYLYHLWTTKEAFRRSYNKMENFLSSEYAGLPKRANRRLSRNVFRIGPRYSLCRNCSFQFVVSDLLRISSRCAFVVCFSKRVTGGTVETRIHRFGNECKFTRTRIYLVCERNQTLEWNLVRVPLFVERLPP